MKKTAQRLMVLTILVLCVGCDQVSKQVAIVLLRYSPPISYLGDFVRFQYAENSGIMLSIGAMLSAEVRFWMFTVVVAVLLAILLSYILWNRQMDRIQTVAWTVIVAGGLGNLLDRIMRGGIVVDFISVGFGVVRTAVFNLADALVFLGVFLLLLHATKKGKGPEEPENIDKQN